jgi:hydroxyethylthiazole kinase
MSMISTSDHFRDTTADLLHRLRSTTPLVQCITNSVVVNFTANALLAIGAAPAMVDIPDEAGPFASLAGGVLVNLGTPTAEQRQAMLEAVAAAHQSGTRGCWTRSRLVCCRSGRRWPCACGILARR